MNKTIHDEKKIKELIKEEYGYHHDECEDYMKQYAEHMVQKERERWVNYHREQVEIHNHFLEDYDQAPFEWHRGARDEALKAINQE